MGEHHELTAPVPGAAHQTFGPVQMDITAAGDARVKRMIYPPGMRWSVDLKPLAGTEVCEHAHVGFLVQGRLVGAYTDGCAFEFVAPQAVVIEPGHDAWIEGDEPAVLIEVDFERNTVERLGLAGHHHH